MKQNTLRYSLLLLLTAAIWGFAFVAQSVGMDYVQPFTFTAAIPVVLVITNLGIFSFNFDKI